MTKFKEEYEYALAADSVSLGRAPEKSYRSTIMGLFLRDYVWEYQKSLRKLEYLIQSKQTLCKRIHRIWVYRNYRKLGHFLGFSIPPNVFGPGLSIAHHGTIVVNKGARVGENCRIHVGVNIGTEAGLEHAAPKIGNNVYIGPGAKIFGDIVIADGCAIGANAVVNKSFTEPNSLIAGVPAKRLGEVDTSKILIRATELIRRQEVDSSPSL